MHEYVDVINMKEWLQFDSWLSISQLGYMNNYQADFQPDQPADLSLFGHP